MSSNRHETWNSNLGVMLAVAGSAVGFGNFLRFPGLAAQYGGGAFMIAYFVAFLLLGIPLCWVEWTFGRRGGIHGAHSTPSIFLHITRHRFWKYIGLLGVVAPLSVAMYYMYLEACTMGYTWHTAVGDLNLGQNSDNYGAFFANFVGVTQDGAIFSGSSTILIFLCITALINLYLLFRGISRGIEWFCKWSMPVLLITAIIIMVRVLTLGTPDANFPERNVNEGLGYMWNPQKTVLVDTQNKNAVVDMVPANATPKAQVAFIQQVKERNPDKTIEVKHITLLEGLLNKGLWIAAAGQVFFSLSIGFGTVCTYASYVHRHGDIALTSITANAANALTEVGIAGLMIVPAAVSFLGVAAAACASTFGLGFAVLPQVFAAMPMGQLFGTLFFGLLLLAAITSSLSMLQPAIAFLEEFWNLKRSWSVSIVAFFMIVGSFLVAWYTEGLMALDTLDFWVCTLSIYLISFMLLIIFNFIWKTKRGIAELNRGALINIPKALTFIVQWITPIILVAIFGSWLYDNLSGNLSPQIQNIVDGKSGAVVPMLWVLVSLIFFAIVAMTSRNIKKR